MRLGTLLLRDGRITQAQLDTAIAHQARVGGRLGTVLIELRLIDAEALSVYLGLELGIPVAPRAVLERAKRAAVRLLKPHMAERYCCVPLVLQDRQLIIAMRDPHDLVALDELADLTGHRIIPRVAAEVFLYYFIERYYGVPRPARFRAMGEWVVAKRRPAADDFEPPAPPLPGLPPPVEHPIAAPPGPAPALRAIAVRDEVRAPAGGRPAVGVAATPAAAAATAPATAPVPATAPAPAVAPAPATVPAPATGAAPAGPARSAAAPAAPTPVADADVVEEVLDEAQAAGEVDEPTEPGRQAPAGFAAPGAAAEGPAAEGLGELEGSLDVGDVTDQTIIEGDDDDLADVVPAAPLDAGAPPADTGRAPIEAAEPGRAPAPPPGDAHEGPAAAEPPPYSLDEALAAIERAGSRGEVGDALVRCARGLVDLVALLVVREGYALGWRGFGPDLDLDRIEALLVPIEAPSVFRSAIELADAFAGAVPPSALHAHLFKILRTDPPAQAVVVPIVIRERVVNLLYAQRARGILAPGELETLRRLAAAASQAYVRLIAVHKHGA